MPTAEFLEERRDAVAGSDVPHLLGLAPYGCRRRLWYDKARVPQDYPWLGNRHTRRGQALEVPAWDEYCARTGRTAVAVPWWQVPGTRLGCHADRLLEAEGKEGRGVGELKCPAARNFYPMRRSPDPPLDALAQLQWCMVPWQAAWGTVMLFCADAWDYAAWDVPADPGFQANMEVLAYEFWDTLAEDDNPNPRLEPTDRRCQDCPWRGRCQGLGEEAAHERPEALAVEEGEEVAVEEALAQEAVRDFLGARTFLRDAEQELALARARLESLMGNRPGRLRCAAGSASLKRVRRKEYTAKVRETTYMSLIVKPPQEVDDDDRAEPPY